MLRALHDLPAPAKLNAFLHLVGRRDDGYHLLQSAFVLIDWADVIDLERREDGRLERRDRGAALPADDLCLRAARLLQAESATPGTPPPGATISIHKSVPWGAGLGGGSSDAATTLLGLNRLWGLNWPRARLIELGARLGADVPFFLGGSNAFVEGIGEKLTPIDWPPTHYCVVKPATSLPTPEVFAHPLTRRIVDAAADAAILLGSFARDRQAAEWGPERVSERTSEGFQDWGRNDLQPAAQECCPEVAQAARWLEARFGNSRMTGSGSAVFARVLAKDGNAEPPEATSPADLPPGWVVRRCRSLPRHPLAGWAD